MIELQVEKLITENAELKENLKEQSCSGVIKEQFSSGVNTRQVKNSYNGRVMEGSSSNTPFKLNYQPSYPRKKEAFPIVLPSYSDKVKPLKKDYSFQVKTYLNNFKKITDLLNDQPSKLIVSNPKYPENFNGYTTFKHDKTNVLCALPECNPNLIKATYDYGLLHSAYTLDGSEFAKIPELYKVIQGYLKITKAKMIFIRCYSSVGEVTYDEIYQATKLIRIGVTSSCILPEEVKGIQQRQLIIEEIPELLKKKRVWQLKLIADAIDKIIERPIWVNYSNENIMITTQATSYGHGAQDKLFELFWSIVTPQKQKCQVIPRSFMPEETQKLFCQVMKAVSVHECKWCGVHISKVPKVEDIVTNDLNEDVDIDELQSHNNKRKSNGRQLLKKKKLKRVHP